MEDEGRVAQDIAAECFVNEIGLGLWCDPLGLSWRLGPIGKTVLHVFGARSGALKVRGRQGAKDVVVDERVEVNIIAKEGLL